jgi:hypothetical protein
VDDIKINLKKWCDGVERIVLNDYRVHWRALVSAVIKLRFS